MQCPLAGIQDRGNKQSTGNQSVPEQSQNTPTESTSRQQSIESLESEDDFSSAIIGDVPAITITPASTALTTTPGTPATITSAATAEETAEQNVPETQETTGGDDAVIVGGDDDSDDVCDVTTSTDRDR